MKAKPALREPCGSSAACGLTPTREEIAERAYGHYLERGMEHGRHVEDWLRAEQELQQEMDGERMAAAA